MKAAQEYRTPKDGYRRQVFRYADLLSFCCRIIILKDKNIFYFRERDNNHEAIDDQYLYL